MAELNSTKAYEFKTFIDEFPLPQVVKVIEGVYGNEDDLTLSALQVIHLHFLKNSDTVKATDEKNREYYLPINSSAKVEVLPNPFYQEFYANVRKLAQDFPTYVQACEDDSELQIEVGDVLKLKAVTTNPHDEKYLRCKCANKEKQEVWIPFSYEAKFRTLGDFVEHSNLLLKEVVAKTPHFPVQVKFQDNCLKTKRRDINAGCPTGFNQLGILVLREAFVMKLVVATACSAHHGSERTLLTIPHDLGISVTPVLPVKNERCACQTGKHCQIENFKIDFNETSFKYGVNVIEGHLSKPDNSKKPIPRDRVTPGVTCTSPSLSRMSGHDKQTEYNSDDVSSCSEDETEKKVTCTDDIERRDNENQEEYYVDMSFANFVESESLIEKQSKNYEAKAAPTIAAAAGCDDPTAATTAADDYAADCGGRVAATSSASGGGGSDDDDDDIKNRPLSTSSIPSSHVSTSVVENDETNDHDTPVSLCSDSFVLQLPHQAWSPPGSIVENPRDDTYDDVFQGGQGHLCLPPFVPEKQNRHKTRSLPFHKEEEEEAAGEEENMEHVYVPITGEDGEDQTCIQRHKTRSVSLEKEKEEEEEEENVEQYVPMTGQAGAGHTSFQPHKTRSVSLDNEVYEHVEQYVQMTGEVGDGHRRETRQQERDLGPSILYDSSPTSSPHYNVPTSHSQKKSGKSKSKMRRNIEKLTSVFKRSKSTSDMTSSGDYHYVESIPDAKADKQTDIAKSLSQLQKSKKKGSKDLIPVDYLSTLTVDEVSESLKTLNLHRYVETFRSNTVDGSLFLDLNDKMLDELQVTSEIDRLKIRKLQTEGWTPKYH